MNRPKLAILIAIIALGFVLRVYKFDNPIADWHSWRQADTSAVSRNFINEGFDLLHPRFDDLSNVPSGKFDNPQGYRFVEFPIYNVFHAGLYKLFGFFTLEQWGRLLTIFTSLLSVIFIYLIVKKHSDLRTALISAFFFSVIPFSVYYGRVILPDPMCVTAILGGIYFFDLFLEGSSRKWIHFLISLIFLIIAILLKPFALFFTLPMIYLVFQKFGKKAFNKWYLWFYAASAVVPFALWRIWMSQFPEGIPSSVWLFNLNHIRFKGAFFYWIFADRLGRLMLGYWGIALLIMGFLVRLKREDYLFFLSFVASSLIYVTVLASGNVQHDYYQILILPSVCIMLGLGANFLFSLPSNALTKYSIFIVVTFFTLFFGWYSVRDYYNINDLSIVTSGKLVDELVPKDSKVIALYDGSTTFLYHTKRKGWASLQNDLPKMVNKGADYLALVNPKPADLNFSKEYKILYSSDKLLLYDLSLPAGRQGQKP